MFSKKQSIRTANTLFSLENTTKHTRKRFKQVFDLSANPKTTQSNKLLLLSEKTVFHIFKFPGIRKSYNQITPAGQGWPEGHIVQNFIRFGATFGSVCTRILFLSPPNSVQNRSNWIKKVRIWCFFLISLYTNPIPESAQNRISNCSDETLKTQFLRAWRPKPGQMSNTEVMSPYRRTDGRTDGRTDRQTNILFLRLTTQWALRAIITYAVPSGSSVLSIGIQRI